VLIDLLVHGVQREDAVSHMSVCGNRRGINLEQSSRGCCDCCPWTYAEDWREEEELYLRCVSIEKEGMVDMPTRPGRCCEEC